MSSNTKNILHITLFTFVVTLVISYFFQLALAFWISITVLILVILAGVLFDIIGTAVTAADESPFHAMGADRVKGSRQSFFLIRNAHTVANFCNDAIGDISGTISGALVTALILEFVRQHPALPERWLSAVAIAFTAALTVFGKALGKSYAIRNANDVIFKVGKFLAFLKVPPHFFNPKKSNRNRKSNSNKKARKP